MTKIIAPNDFALTNTKVDVSSNTAPNNRLKISILLFIAIVDPPENAPPAAGTVSAAGVVPCQTHQKPIWKK